jgi:hypothetical protein
MIATRVAETERLAGRADAGERPPPGPPQAPPQARPPAPKPPAKPAGGIAAGVIGVLLIALLVAVATKDESGTSHNAGATSTPTATPSSSRTSGLTSSGRSTRRPSPTPNPTWEAFDEISVNDCLDAYKDPYDSSEWSENMPNAVSCSRSDAYVKVTGIRSSSTACNAEALDGESWWRSPVHDGDAIYLCVRRQFRKGECFLGKRGSEKGRVAVNGHGLMTSWSCGKDTVPKGFNYILQFTGYYVSRCPSGSRRWKNFRKGVLCARIV